MSLKQSAVYWLVSWELSS